MGKSADLALRIKAAIQQQEEAARRAATEEARQVEEAQQRREAVERACNDLLDEIRAFGKALGLDVKSKGEHLMLKFGSRTVVFTTGDPARLPVRFEGAGPDDHLAWDDAAWVLHSGDRTLPFLDAGLEEIAVLGLGLPRPEAAASADIPPPTPAEEEPVAPPTPAATQSPRPSAVVDGTTRPYRPKPQAEVQAPVQSRTEKADIGSSLREPKKLW